MKAILCLALVLSLTFAMTMEEFEEQAGMSFDEAMQLVDGILAGLNVKADVEHLKVCVEKVPNIILTFKNLIEDFKKVDWKDPESIFNILSELFDTMKQLVETIKPCFQIPKDIEKLIEKFKKIDINKLLTKILGKLFELFSKVTDCLKQFELKEYRKAGKCLGDIVYMILLEDVYFDEDVTLGSFKDFMKGFLEGLGVKGDIQKILACVKEGEEVIKKIEEAIKKFKHISLLHIKDVIEGVKLLFEAVHMCVNIIKECAKDEPTILKLIKALAHLNYATLAYHIVKNAGSFIKDIAKLAAAIASKDMEGAGKALGDIVKKLILGNLELEDPAIDFFHGFFHGIGAEQEFEKIKGCIKDISKIIERIVEAIKLIATFNIQKVIEGVTKLIAAVTELFLMIKPCMEGANRLKQLVEAIMHADIVKIAWKIVTNIGKVIADITKIINGFKSQNFYDVGDGLGNFLETLFL